MLCVGHHIQMNYVKWRGSVNASIHECMGVEVIERMNGIGSSEQKCQDQPQILWFWWNFLWWNPLPEISIATRMGVNVWNTLQVFDDYKGPLAHSTEGEWVRLLRLWRRSPRSLFLLWGAGLAKQLIAWALYVQCCIGTVSIDVQLRAVLHLGECETVPYPTADCWAWLYI